MTIVHVARGHLSFNICIHTKRRFFGFILAHYVELQKKAWLWHSSSLDPGMAIRKIRLQFIKKKMGKQTRFQVKTLFIIDTILEEDLTTLC